MGDARSERISMRLTSNGDGTGNLSLIGLSSEAMDVVLHTLCEAGVLVESQVDAYLHELTKDL